METIKPRYEAPKLDELTVNAFAVIAGASKIDEVNGDVAEDDLDV